MASCVKSDPPLVVDNDNREVVVVVVVFEDNEDETEVQEAIQADQRLPSQFILGAKKAPGISQARWTTPRLHAVPREIPEADGN